MCPRYCPARFDRAWGRKSQLATLLACALTLLLVGPGAGFAARRPVYRGRPLIEALERLQAEGLHLIYSTAVVSEEIVVTVEPAVTEPRAILDEILPPLGLEARDGPGGSVLIVGTPHPAPGKLDGRVVSAGRRRPIPRASVRILGTELQTITRPDGTFEIPFVPVGTYEVAASASGFSNVLVVNVRVSPGSTTELAVTLEALPSFVEEIVVTPSRHAIVRQEQSSRMTLRNEDAVLVPTIGGDVSRVVELLPGVAAPDNSAAFSVRGSEARDVSLVLDGLELYEPFHLQSFQSPFSIIDSRIVDTIEFLGGGFTADFGDRHGGFVQLTTALPEGSRRTGIELGTLNSRVSYGAPLSSGSLLLSARAWYPEALRDAIELGETGVDPRFSDVYLKYSQGVSPRTVVSAHALMAYDRLEFTEPDGNERVDSQNRSAYLWVRALTSWSPGVFSETVLSAGRLDRSRQGISEPEDEPITVDDDRTVEFFRLRHDLTCEVSSSHLLRAGFEVRPLEGDYRYATEAAGGATTRELDPSGKSFGAYMAHRAAVSENLATELGLRWDRQTYTDDTQLSPRFNAIWRAGERSELRVGWGRFFQSQRIHELRVEDGETSFLPAEVSRQVVMTFQHRFLPWLRLRLDAYDRRLSRVRPRYENLFNPLELFPETETDRVLVAPRRAQSRGVELLLRGDPSQALHWWASYARSSAEDVIDGTEAPRSWDQPHAGKFLVGYRWDRGWAVSVSGTVHSGWPTTPVSGEARTLPDGSVVIDPVRGPRNSERFPTYARLDVKASRAISLAWGRLRVDLEVVNVTDRNNVCCVDEFVFAQRPDGTVDVRRELNYWLGFTPSFSLLWEF